MKFRTIISLVCLALGLFIIGCTDSEFKTESSVKVTDAQLRASSNPAKLALIPESLDKPILSRTPITYLASVCDDASIPGVHTTSNSYAAGASYWDYYSFYAVAGETVGVSVSRVTCEMDPSFVIYQGTTDDTDNLGSLTFVGFWDDECAAACETCFAWYDPCLSGWVVGTSGWYTVGVMSYLSCAAPPYSYTLNITGLEADADGVCGDVDNCPSVYNPDQANCDGDAEGDACDADDDNDGVLDVDDAVDCSNLDPTVNIDGCDSGVDNYVFPDGSSMMDLILACCAEANNHGQFVSCVSHLTNEWKALGLITGAQKGAIISCAGQSSSCD